MKIKISEHSVLSKEWHTSKNLPLKSNELTIGSQKKVWWKCEQGHEWQAFIHGRANNPSCPYCSKRRPSPEYNLKTTNSEICKEWNYEKNNSTPEEFLAGSKQKVWWKCELGHEWEAKIANRTFNKTNCPYCSNHKVSHENSLQAQNAKLSQEWHPDKNKLKPSDVVPGSNKLVWWKCELGHEWEAKITNRTFNKTNCPYCANQKVTSENSLYSTHPKLIEEWDEIKNSLSPKDVVAGSHKKVWWKCGRGHSWSAAVKHRAINGTKCPKCNPSTSLPEIRLMTELKYFFDIGWQEKVLGFEVDIYIEKLKLGIEYDGNYYHEKKTQQDRLKNKKLLSHGIRLLRVRERPLNKISTDDVIINSGELNKKDVETLLKQIQNISGNQLPLDEYRKHSGFINEKLYKYYVSFLPDPFPEKSLHHLHPELVKLWDYDKNDPLVPKNFIATSHQKVWWKCEKNHSWQQDIKTASNRKSSDCPFCNKEKKLLKNSHPHLREFYDDSNESKFDEISISKPQKLKWKCHKGHVWDAWLGSILGSEPDEVCPLCKKSNNSLTHTNPEILSEWDYDKNEITPSEVSKGQHTKVWWKCSRGHSWQAKVFYRFRKDRPSGCPICRKNLKSPVT